MSTARPLNQRDMMRLIWRSHAPDEERTIREYAAREEAGEVSRNSNRLGTPPLKYARQLLNDGRRHGWLDGVARDPLNRPAAPLTIAPASIPLAIPASTASTRLDWAAAATRALRARPESLGYLERVHAWRAAWRPNRVRVLLVAESHVAEHPGDMEVLVHLPNFAPVSTALPLGYCRLVYCLGYGESRLCGPRAPDGNGRTWQYWDLFGAVASVYDASIPAAMPRRSASDLRARLDWKLRVLATMQQAGVWLEDASIIALYSPGGARRATGAAYNEVVRSSFETFVWPAVAADAPEQIWIIGRGVGGALQGLPGVLNERVISQPQDRDQARYRADVARLRAGLPSWAHIQK